MSGEASWWERLRGLPELRPGRLACRAMKMRWGEDGIEIGFGLEQPYILRLGLAEIASMSIQFSRSRRWLRRLSLLRWVLGRREEERLFVELRAAGFAPIRLSTRVPEGHSIAMLPRLDGRGSRVEFELVMALIESALALGARLQDWGAVASDASSEQAEACSAQAAGVTVDEQQVELRTPAAPPGWAHIPAGSFLMGSPVDEKGRHPREREHWVELSTPFLMSVKPVTQFEWKQAIGQNPAKFESSGPGAPVEQVSWYDAMMFCNVLSRNEFLQECYEFSEVKWLPGKVSFEAKVVWNRAALGYRLPTEAEWEYACRAGTEGPFNNASARPDAMAWYGENSDGKTHPVAHKRPNAWGLYDMHGNVWEWTWDVCGPYPGSFQKDPVGPESGAARIVRGGSWSDYSKKLRSAHRSWNAPKQRGSNLGFRIVRTLEASTSAFGSLDPK